MVPECILKLMDFSEEYEILAQEEFNGKYANTWMLVNDKVQFIEYLKQTHLECTDTVIPNRQIETIKPLFPKIGLYIVNDNLVYLSKLQKRQYLKSFCLDTTHKITNVYPSDFPYRTKEFLEDGKYLGETAEFKTYLWLRWKPVASVNHYNRIIYVKQDKFIPEIQELWNQQLGYTLKSQHQELPDQQPGNLLKPNKIEWAILDDPIQQEAGQERWINPFHIDQAVRERVLKAIKQQNF